MGLGFFMTVIFTRAVFVSHDILHLQYFKNKSLSFKLSYPFAAFIAQSYNFAIKCKLWGELVMMLMYWPLVWGTLFYFLPLGDAVIVLLTLNFILSPWLAFGFITNHLGCEVFDYEGGKTVLLDGVTDANFAFT